MQRKNRKVRFMKKLYFALLLLTLSFSCFAVTENLALESRLFQGGENGFQWDKPATRGEVRTVFYRYDSYLTGILSAFIGNMKNNFNRLDDKLDSIPAQKDYSIDIEAMQRVIDILSDKLEQNKQEISKLKRQQKIDYAGIDKANVMVQEWMQPAYVGITVANASGYQRNILEAGYSFRFIDAEWTAKVTPMAQLDSGSFYTGVRAELHWGQ